MKKKPAKSRRPGAAPGAPPLTPPAAEAAARLLLRGRVLVAGGFDPSARALTSAVLYDPGTNEWSETGGMLYARAAHTATLLADGRVLAAGGSNLNLFDAVRVEVYDPALAQWQATGPLLARHQGFTATLLHNGRVFVTGTIDPPPVAAELYDPPAQTWTATGQPNPWRHSHTATLLPDGRVLAVGGSLFGYTNTAAFYHPGPGNWTPAASLQIARYAHTATLLRDGGVLVAGGLHTHPDPGASAGFVSDGRGTDRVELYRPDQWTVVGPLRTARRYHTATLLRDGSVLVAGGYDVGYNALDRLASVERYDPATGTWTTVAPLNQSRAGHTATLLTDGRVLVAGGGDTAEVYDPDADAWTYTGPFPEARGFHTATLIGTRLLVANPYVSLLLAMSGIG